MKTGRAKQRHWFFHLTWEQWAVPLSIWWWPIEKDRAFGIHIGPLQWHWEKHPHDWPERSK